MLIRKIRHSLKSIFDKLTNQTGLKKVFFNFNWLVSEKVLNMALGVTIGAWVARFLGPETYGRLNFASSFVSLFTFLSTLGLDSIVFRDLVDHEDEKDSILGTTFVLKLIGSFVLNLVALSAVLIIRPTDSSLHLLVFIVAFGYLFKPFDAVAYWFRSKVRSKYAVLSRTTIKLVISGLKVVFIIFSAPLFAFVAIISFNTLLTSGMYIWHYYSQTGDSVLRWNFNFKWAKSLLKDSWPLLFSGAATTIHMHIDKVMIGQFLGDEQLGIYSAATKLLIFGFFATAMANSLFPHLVDLRERDYDLYRKRFQNLLTFLTWGALFLGVVITIFSGFIIWLIFGPEYQRASLVLSIQIWGAALGFFGIASAKDLLAENLTKVMMWRTIVGGSANILLNYFLIPLYGLIGASIVNSLSTLVGSILLLLFWKKTRHLPIMFAKSFHPGNLIEALKFEFL